MASGLTKEYFNTEALQFFNVKPCDNCIEVTATDVKPFSYFYFDLLSA